MKNIVMYSGGLNSFMVAYLLQKEYPLSDNILLFADTLIEDEDLYRFLMESSERLGIPLVILSDGRNPWEVFEDVRFIGNTRVDPCSRVLKREITSEFVYSRFVRTETIKQWSDESEQETEQEVEFYDANIYIGIDWTETHRVERIREKWSPFNVEMPLIEEPYYAKSDILKILKAMDIKPPRLYEMGFPHNNCGGFCTKAGQGQFKLLNKHFPERFKWHQEKEQEMREYLGKDVAILRDRRGGVTKPLPMSKFKEMLKEDESQLDLFEFGGCGCFTD